MAFHHLEVVLAGNTPISTSRIPFKQLIISNPSGNAAVNIGDKNISATSFGFPIAAGAVGPVIGPFSGELPANLNEIYLKGTDTQIIHVAYVT